MKNTKRAMQKRQARKRKEKWRTNIRKAGKAFYPTSKELALSLIRTKGKEPIGRWWKAITKLKKVKEITNEG